MKITFICNKITGRGGTETVLVKVLNGLKKRGYDVRLVLSNLTDDKKWLSRINSQINYVYPKNDSRLGRLLFFAKIFKQVKNKETFIILSPNLVRYFSLLERISHKQVTIVSWIHFSLDHQNFFNPKVLLSADYHLAISSAIKQQLVAMGVPDNRIFLIFNPADMHHMFRPHSQDNKSHLLYIGRVQQFGQKNLAELLSGIKQVSSDIILDVYGSGKDLRQCKNQCRTLGIQNRVVWHGWSNDVWKDINFKPMALILTSKFEGLPMVFLEAMSRGIPCISADFDGYDDVVVEKVNGFSYHLGNTTQLASTIEKTSEMKFIPSEIQNSIEKYYSDDYYDRLENSLRIIENKGKQ